MEEKKFNKVYDNPYFVRFMISKYYGCPIADHIFGDIMRLIPPDLTTNRLSILAINDIGKFTNYLLLTDNEYSNPAHKIIDKEELVYCLHHVKVGKIHKHRRRLENGNYENDIYNIEPKAKDRDNRNIVMIKHYHYDDAANTEYTEYILAIYNKFYEEIKYEDIKKDDKSSQ